MLPNSFSMSNRVDWIDYAKGICIIWVVTLYSTDYVKEITHTIGWMQQVVNFAQPFRMPDFFLLSGLFVSRVIARPWRTFIDRKVLHFLYFYVVWSTLKFANMYWQKSVDTTPLDLLSNYARMFIEPPTGPLWFLHTLIIFFIVVRLLRRVPVAAVLPTAICLQLVATWGDVQIGMKVADKFARYFVFFYSGYVFAPFFFRATQWAHVHVRSAVIMLMMWFGINQILVALHATFAPGMQLVLGFAGATAVMVAAVLLSGTRNSGWLRYLGQHSIVVYLGFVIPLGMMRRLIIAPPADINIGALSLFISVACIAGAVLLYWAVRDTPLRFLYTRPEWARLKEPVMSPANVSSTYTGGGVKPMEIIK